MDCNRIKKYLHEYIDGDLDKKKRELVEEHLSSCMRCASDFASMKSYLEEMEALPDVKAPQNFVAQVENRLHQGRFRRLKNLWQMLNHPPRSRLILDIAVTAAAVFIVISILYLLPFVHKTHESKEIRRQNVTLRMAKGQPRQSIVVENDQPETVIEAEETAAAPAAAPETVIQEEKLAERGDFDAKKEMVLSEGAASKPIQDKLLARGGDSADEIRTTPTTAADEPISPEALSAFQREKSDSGLRVASKPPASPKLPEIKLAAALPSVVQRLKAQENALQEEAGFRDQAQPSLQERLERIAESHQARITSIDEVIGRQGPERAFTIEVRRDKMKALLSELTQLGILQPSPGDFLQTLPRETDPIRFKLLTAAEE